ncbi:hypothetical protein H4O18_18095 [Arenibacter sp. BSSL-BM3]|uniref:Uncharacterized protein n=1 Tax=Arenibacter arenosicollis TaxID=2762274 RepID=A0ABR7QRU7_9FLAO|nr:hypothetical protein [Arenibacter arenosicollis]MBC8769915.1 hypothetical protein [Arenibacter arenosicollis]
MDNGERLRNKPVRSLINGDIGFALGSNRWVYWHIVSGEIEQLAHEENEKIVINDWFKDRNFNMGDKIMIYQYFKDHGRLEGETLEQIEPGISLWDKSLE